MTYKVILDDGTTMEVKVYRDCTDAEARERVGHFFPERRIIAITKQPDAKK